jgi:hypothetical protein
MTSLRERLIEAGVEPLADLAKIASRPDTPFERAVEILLMIQERIDAEDGRGRETAPTPATIQPAAPGTPLAPPQSLPAVRKIGRRPRSPLNIHDMIDVMRAVADGMDRKDVAELMSVSPQTIGNVMARKSAGAHEAGRQWDAIRAAAQRSYAVGGASRPLGVVRPAELPNGGSLNAA